MWLLLLALASCLVPGVVSATGVVFGSEQVISSTALAARSVVSADLDGDGDLDALSASSVDFIGVPDDDAIAWYENRSGQSEIFTAATAPALPLGGAQVEISRIDVTHLGRVGDADEELGTLVFAFDRAPATSLTSDPVAPLSSAEANALIDDLHVYRDDGSGVFEPGMDALVATVASLSLTGGVQTLDLPGADADVQFSARGSPRSFAHTASVNSTCASPRCSGSEIREPRS